MPYGAHRQNARTGTGSGLFVADSLTPYAASHAVCCRVRAEHGQSAIMRGVHLMTG
jgi:hypothetical protein